MTRPAIHLAARLLLCALPWAATYGLYRWLLHQDQLDQAAPIHRLDLLDGDGTLPADARFVALSGVPATDYLACHPERGAAAAGQRVTTVVPVVGRDWRRDSAVRFVVSADGTRDTRWFFATAVPSLREFKAFVCRIAGGASDLPEAVQREFHRSGLQLAPTCLVLRPASAHDGHIAGRAESEAWWLIPWLGGGLSVVLTVVVAARWFQRRAQEPPPAPPSGEPVYPDLRKT